MDLLAINCIKLKVPNNFYCQSSCVTMATERKIIQALHSRYRRLYTQWLYRGAPISKTLLKNEWRLIYSRKLLRISDVCTNRFPSCKSAWEQVLHWRRPRKSGRVLGRFSTKGFCRTPTAQPAQTINICLLSNVSVKSIVLSHWSTYYIFCY